MNQAGIAVQLDFDDEGNMIRRDVQDVGFAVDSNKEERLSGDNDRSGASARKFASVPMIVLQMLKDQHGIDWNLFGICPDHTGRLLAYLQENTHFRTSEAKLANGNRYVR